MTKNNNEDFKNSTKCWICDNGQIGGNVKVRDNYYIIGKKEALHIKIVISRLN